MRRLKSGLRIVKGDSQRLYSEQGPGEKRMIDPGVEKHMPVKRTSAWGKGDGE
jgi:hypothetical protein